MSRLWGVVKLSTKDNSATPLDTRSHTSKLSRKRVDVRRVLVKPLLSDYAANPASTNVTDHITRSQTVQALSRFGIELSAAEAQLLFDRYDTLGVATVNYVALVRDIELPITTARRGSDAFGASPMSACPRRASLCCALISSATTSDSIRSCLAANASNVCSIRSRRSKLSRFWATSAVSLSP